MVYSYEFSITNFQFSIIDFITGYSNNFWMFIFDRSYKIPCFELWASSFKLWASHIMLYHTSCYSYFLICSNCLKFPCNFIFGFLFDRTGIENYYICFFAIFCIRKSAVDEYCFYSCTICIVHLASKNKYMELHFYYCF